MVRWRSVETFCFLVFFLAGYDSLGTLKGGQSSGEIEVVNQIVYSRFVYSGIPNPYVQKYQTGPSSFATFPPLLSLCNLGPSKKCTPLLFPPPLPPTL